MTPAPPAGNRHTAPTGYGLRHLRFTLDVRVKVRQLYATLRPLPFARVYAGAFLLVNLILLVAPGRVRAGVELATSTNVAHLAVDPLFVLPASAMIDQGQLWLWIPLILGLVGGLESHIGTRRTLVAVFGAHVVASVLSEGILLARVAAHLEPTSMLHVVDVGPSYMILAALAGCLVVGGLRLRLAALGVGALILPGLLHGVTALDMSAVGHLSALLLGSIFTVWLTRRFALRTDRLALVWTRIVWSRPPLRLPDPARPASLPGARVRRPLRPVAALVRPLLGRLRPRRSPAPASDGAGRCR
jgi:hypothetical protein